VRAFLTAKNRTATSQTIAIVSGKTRLQRHTPGRKNPHHRLTEDPMSYPYPPQQQPAQHYPQPPYPYPQTYRPPYPLPTPQQPMPNQPMAWGPPQVDPRSPYPTHNTGGNEPLFQVRITKHTGLVYIWVNQRRTFTGTVAQCETAIRNAQLHNLLAGWWGIVSLLLMNWIALFENLGARKTLRRQASAHPYFAPQPSPPQAPRPPWPPGEAPAQHRH
jgi:hypothetical protein